MSEKLMAAVTEACEGDANLAGAVFPVAQAMAADAEAAGLKIDWAKLIQAILALLAAFQTTDDATPAPVVPTPTPSPKIVSAVTETFGDGTMLKKFNEILTKYLPLILELLGKFGAV